MTDRDEKKFVDYVKYTLKAPIIVHPMWMDLTEEMKQSARMSRLGRHPESIECSDYEAMLYLSSSSLVSPLSESWFRLYVHLFVSAHPDHKDFQEGVSPPSEYELGLLKGLKQWIFKQQMQSIKEKRKLESVYPALS